MRLAAAAATFATLIETLAADVLAIKPDGYDEADANALVDAWVARLTEATP